MKKKLLLSVFILASMCNVPVAADQKPQSWFSKAKQSISDHKSEIADTTLVLSAVWLAVGAVGAYRLSSAPTNSVPKWLGQVLGLINIFNLEQQIQFELTSLGCAGGSLSALSLLMLKKLSWEKKDTIN